MSVKDTDREILAILAEKAEAEEKRARERAEAERVRVSAAPGALQQHGFNQMQVGGYCKAPADFSAEAWEEERKKNASLPWRATPQGRLAMRCFSRGIMGAAFYTAGWRYAAKQMEGFHPEEAPKNWVQGIARLFDNVAGKPIQLTVNMLGGDGKKAVTFRPTRKFYGGLQDGRTLGHEVVAVTFDFASASVGDAIGRDIFGIFDPNATKSWLKEGHIDYPQAVKSLAMSTFRYFTYNQAEDWAVALPYVYFMRAQRGIINKFSPGFAYDFDRGLNGASFKVNSQGKVVGNYNVEGAIDLQTRFTVYNMGTVMYREAYMEVADRLLKWRESGFDLSSLDPTQVTSKGFAQSIADGVKHVMHWAARDVIKGGLYMTPAVPFFWAFRTPQGKYQGLFIHPEKGALAYRSGPNRVDMIHANEWKRTTNEVRPPERQFTPESPTVFSQYANGQWSTHGAPENPFAQGPFNAYAQTFGPFDKALNTLGSINNKVRKAFHKPIRWAEAQTGYRLDQDYALKRKSDAYVRATFAYTPYFWTKAEFSNLWDNGKMDQSIERTIDGATDFNFSEFKAGLGEIWQTLKHEPLSDPEREKLGRHRIRDDTSASEIFDPEIGKAGHRGSKVCHVERLQKQKEEAQKKLDQFRAKHSHGFANGIIHERMQQSETPAGLLRDGPLQKDGYVAYENARSRDDFPPLGTVYQ